MTCVIFCKLCNGIIRWSYVLFSEKEKVSCLPFFWGMFLLLCLPFLVMCLLSFSTSSASVLRILAYVSNAFIQLAKFLAWRSEAANDLLCVFIFLFWCYSISPRLFFNNFEELYFLYVLCIVRRTSCLDDSLVSFLCCKLCRQYTLFWCFFFLAVWYWAS